MRDLPNNDLCALTYRLAESFMALSEQRRVSLLRSLSKSQRGEVLAGVALAVRDKPRLAPADPPGGLPKSSLKGRYRPKALRPLSPYEFLTGERFSDHRTPADAELDRMLGAS